MAFPMTHMLNPGPTMTNDDGPLKKRHLIFFTLYSRRIFGCANAEDVAVILDR